MTTAASLFELAMELDDDEREELADRLYDSVACETPEWEAAWLAEAKRRMVEIDTGDVEAVPWSEARQVLFAPIDGE